MINPGIVVNGKEYILLKSGGYTHVKVAPGKHEIGVKLSDRYGDSKKIILDVELNSEYFVRVSSSFKGFTYSYERKFYIEQISGQEAEAEISSCRYMS